MKKVVVVLVLMGLLALLSACQTTPNPTPDPKPDTNLTVIISPGSLLLENIGVSQQLTATVLDKDGKAVSATVTWESGKSDVVSINSAGIAEGLTVGSSLIRARVGNSVSAPVIAAVAKLSTDVANIAAENILTEPSFIDIEDGEAVTIGNQYTVVVQNINPTIGAKWFSHGKDNERLQGKIVKVEDQDNNRKLVTLEVVPYEEIFSELIIDEEIDFSQATDTIPPGFDEESLEAQAFVGFGALECELSGVGGTPPITLGVPSMSISMSTDNARTGINFNVGFGRPATLSVRFRGNLNANLLMTGRINRDFRGSVDCRTRLPIVRNIVGIPLPLFSSLSHERGLGVKLSGDFSGPTTNFSASGNLSVNYDIGASINFNTGNVTPFNTVSSTPNGLFLINQQAGITVFDASAEAYVYENWVLGVPGISFDIWENRNGIRSSMRAISVPQQITSGARSSYRLDRVGRNGPGREFARFLRFFNARELFPRTQTYTDAIRTTPFTLSSFDCSTIRGSGRCDTSFSERRFPVVGDNILKIEVWARTGNQAPRKLNETTGQALNNTRIQTTISGIAEGDRCFLAIYTKTMPFAGIVAATDNNCFASGN